MKRLISAILLLTIMFSLCSCVSERSITPTTYESGYDGVYVTIDFVEGEGLDRKLVTTWHNETEKDVTFGYAYTIEYNDGGEWKSCQYRDFAVIEMACILAPGKTAEMKYETEYFNLFRVGEYRLVVDFTTQVDDDNFPRKEDDNFSSNGEVLFNPDNMSQYYLLGKLIAYFTVN